MVGYVSQLAEMSEEAVDKMVAAGSDETVVNSHGQPVAAESTTILGGIGNVGMGVKVAVVGALAYVAWKQKWLPF